MRISDWSSDVCSSDLTLHSPLGEAGQLLVSLDREYLVRHLPHDSGGITGAGADLEHPVPRLQPRRLDHQRDDIGLRNRLLGLDRQRRILNGEFADMLRHEFLAWYGAHRVEQPPIRSEERRVGKESVSKC